MRNISISIDIASLSACQLEILREAFLNKIESDLFDVIISELMPTAIAGDPDEIIIGFRFAGCSERAAGHLSSAGYGGSRRSGSSGL
jgi:hypothetical protein